MIEENVSGESCVKSINSELLRKSDLVETNIVSSFLQWKALLEFLVHINKAPMILIKTVNPRNNCEMNSSLFMLIIVACTHLLDIESKYISRYLLEH